MKKCSKCGEVKALEEFYKHPTCSDGRLGKCKRCCVVLADLARRARDPEKEREHRREQARRARERNPEKVRESGRAWRERNPSHAREYARTRRACSPEKVREIGRAWRERNLEKARGVVRACGVRATAELRDYYVRSRLATATGLRAKDIPPELIAAKRVHLQIQRLIKEQSK